MTSIAGQELEAAIGEVIIRQAADRILGHTDEGWFQNCRYYLFLKKQIIHPTLELLRSGQMPGVNSSIASRPEHPAKMLANFILEITQKFHDLKLYIRIRDLSECPPHVNCLKYRNALYVCVAVKNVSNDSLFDLIDFCSDVDAFFMFGEFDGSDIFYSKLVCDGDGYIMAVHEGAVIS